MIVDMSRFAFPAAPSAVADAPKAAGVAELLDVAAHFDGARS